MSKHWSAPAHVTENEFSPIPQDNIERDLTASHCLLPAKASIIFNKAFLQSSLTFRSINNQLVPSICQGQEDVDDASQNAIGTLEQMYRGNVCGMESEGIELNWGPGQTITGELRAAFLTNPKPSFWGRLFNHSTDLTIGIDPQKKGHLIGDMFSTKHPYTEIMFQRLGAIFENNLIYNPNGKLITTFNIDDDTLIKALPRIKLSNVTAIAPTPGTVENLLETLKANLSSKGRFNIVLSALKLDHPDMEKDRNEDLDILNDLVNSGYGITTSVPANDLMEFQNNGTYQGDQQTGLLLNSFGPFDTRYSASGAIFDRAHLNNSLTFFSVNPNKKI